MLIEVVKKLSQAENEVKTLKQKLGDRNVTKNFSLFEYQMSQSVDSDLQCDICYEMFIKVILVNKIENNNFFKFLLLLISV